DPVRTGGGGVEQGVVGDADIRVDDVVGVRQLGQCPFAVDGDPQRVVAGRHVGDVYPLAVESRRIAVAPAARDPLEVAVVARRSCDGGVVARAFAVLQAEGLLVSGRDLTQAGL